MSQASYETMSRGLEAVLAMLSANLPTALQERVAAVVAKRPQGQEPGVHQGPHVVRRSTIARAQERQKKRLPWRAGARQPTQPPAVVQRRVPFWTAWE